MQHSIPMAARSSITQMVYLSTLEHPLFKTRQPSNLPRESSTVKTTTIMVLRLFDMQMVLLQCSKMAASQTIKLHLNNYMFLAKWITSLMAALRRPSLMEQSAQHSHLPALSWMSWLSLATWPLKTLMPWLVRQFVVTSMVQLLFSMSLPINF